MKIFEKWTRVSVFRNLEYGLGSNPTLSAIPESGRAPAQFLPVLGGFFAGAGFAGGAAWGSHGGGAFSH